MTASWPPQKRKKLTLRVFNYSMLDRLDKPLEYRINQQYRARSAESMYVSNELDFEPIETGHVVQYAVHPYPLQFKTSSIGVQVDIATPEHGILSMLWEPYSLGSLHGVEFCATIGGALTSYLTAYEPQKHLTRDVIRPRHKIVVQRAYASFASGIAQLLDVQDQDFIHYSASSKRKTEDFEAILSMVNRSDYLTVKQKHPYANQPRFANSYTFYITKHNKVGLVYDYLERF